MATREKFVQMPRTTVKALKGLLYSQDGEGVNLAPIVQDLTTSEDDEDLVALNVGLVFKGLTPKIDTTARFGWDYLCLKRYDFVSYSLIRNKVTVKVWSFAFNSETNEVAANEPKDCGNRTFDFDEWEAKPTTADESMERLIARYGKHKEEEV